MFIRILLLEAITFESMLFLCLQLLMIYCSTRLLRKFLENSQGYASDCSTPETQGDQKQTPII